MLVSFIPFRMLGVTANIMSLGGIAIAIGALVDAAIVVVEQVHKGLEQWEREGRRGDYQEVVVRAIKQVAGPSFYALLVMAVSFLPVLTLEAQEGRLFKPLAYTKTPRPGGGRVPGHHARRGVADDLHPSQARSSSGPDGSAASPTTCSAGASTPRRNTRSAGR